jgi:DNA-directed RNA polymerase
MFKNQRKKTVTKELDVSASGLQIIGGLLGNLDYLEKTNFLIKKNQLNSKKYDIYSETLKKYLLQKSFHNKNHEKFIKRFFTRKVFKSIIMCYFYNETHFGVVKKLESLGFEVGQGFKLNEEVTLIRKFLKKEFEEYQILSHLINYGVNSSIKNQKAISLYKGNVETFQYYALQEVIQVDYYDRFNKRQKIRVSTDQDPLSLDKRKTRRATLPNFIHNLDSQLLHSVILKAQKCNINLSVIHDCFIIHKKHESKLKKWYFEAFNDLILSKNNSVLISFLKRNLLLNEYENFKKDFPEILEEDFPGTLKEDFLETLKKNDFLKISIKDYKMSPYILS